jgi:integrase
MSAILQFPAPMPSADPTVAEVVGLYIRLEAKLETRTEHLRSWQEKARVLNRFADAHGQLRISQCTKAILRLWIDTNPRLHSDWSRGGKCRIVQRCFNWAADEMELIGRNPFKGVRYAKGKRGRPVTDAEFDAILDLAGPIFAPVMRFCRLTGSRPAEMSGTRWVDVQGDLHAGRAWIVQADHKTGKKTGKPRVIALPPDAISLLLSIKRALGVLPGFEPEFVFLNSRKRRWQRNTICMRWRTIRAKLGLPRDCKLYGCRHAFATQAILNGVEVQELAELLGHSGTQMTQHYLHLAGEHQWLCDMAAKATGGGPSGKRACPHCAEPIQAEAKICRFCGRDVGPPADAVP